MRLACSQFCCSSLGFCYAHFTLSSLKLLLRHPGTCEPHFGQSLPPEVSQSMENCKPLSDSIPVSQQLYKNTPSTFWSFFLYLSCSSFLCLSLSLFSSLHPAPPSSLHTPLTPCPNPTIACPTYEPFIPAWAPQPKHPFLGGLHQAPTTLSGLPQHQPHCCPPPSLSASWHPQLFCSILCASHTNHSSSPVAQLQASSSPT